MASTVAQPDSATRYHFEVVNGSGIVWDTTTSFWKRNPNPYVEILLAGTEVHTTAAQPRTLSPEWDESFTLVSSDPTSMLSIKLWHYSWIPKMSRVIGSTKVRVQDLVDLTGLSKDVSLELFDQGKKVGTVIVRFNEQSLAPPKTSQGPVSGSSKKTQTAGYSSQDASMNQAERVVRQALARSAGK
ncbi:hypothetical protein HYPSUDRAFT_49762 [Hypholoma sublateritium FD-334 SS-4]|uniref:C2 domain-containing protein n=1 Tax=Hypholoma sublateritium (strain FD-334 SS-4) TaxID=945553 RepID=A0A0D2LS19_HYPSF|nr:hypothetical protein HYPSUDRAFT_49762 [Hypholoma sublateritium FD-334 SS-4]